MTVASEEGWMKRANEEQIQVRTPGSHGVSRGQDEGYGDMSGVEPTGLGDQFDVCTQ